MNEPIDQPQTEELPLFHSNSARFRHWRTKLETFKALHGVRPMLEHVSEATWRAHYAANEDAFSAVVRELEKFGD